MESESFAELVERTVDELLESQTEDEVSTLMQLMFSHKSFVGEIEKSECSEGQRVFISNQFREYFLPLYEQWGFLNHALRKPYGYPGDFDVFEYLYDRRPHEDTPERYLHLDLYLFSLSLYRSTIERKNILKHLLGGYLQKNEAIKICSIGCGGARELWELGDGLKHSNVMLVDFDSRAIDFAQRRLKPFAKNIDVLCQDVSRWNLAGHSFDIMYSFGLFDYLPDAIVHRLIRRSKRHLVRGGKYIFALKDYTQFNTHFYYFLGDVEFVRRSVEDGMAIAKKHKLKVDMVIPSESRAINIFVCSDAEIV